MVGLGRLVRLQGKRGGWGGRTGAGGRIRLSEDSLTNDRAQGQRCRRPRHLVLLRAGWAGKRAISPAWHQVVQNLVIVASDGTKKFQASPPHRDFRAIMPPAAGLRGDGTAQRPRHHGREPERSNGLKDPAARHDDSTLGM